MSERQGRKEKGAGIWSGSIFLEEDKWMKEETTMERVRLDLDLRGFGLDYLRAHECGCGEEERWIGKPNQPRLIE